MNAILEERDELDGRPFRLPTEAEWEYAARAGAQSTYCFGPETSRLAQYAWFKNNSGGKTHSVGQLAPNDWGLHDMHGNVHEWCADWYARDTYSHSPTSNPHGPDSGVSRVLRSAGYMDSAYYQRSASRHKRGPHLKSHATSFRCVRELDGGGGR